MAKVKDIMTPAYVECVPPETSIQDAAEIMKAMDVGTLLICDRGKLVGVVTDRDITVRATAAGNAPAVTTLQGVLTPYVVFCFDDQEVAEAAEIMKQRQIRRLAVMNREQRLVGIVSLGDLALRQEDRELAAEILEFVSTCTS